MIKTITAAALFTASAFSQNLDEQKLKAEMRTLSNTVSFYYSEGFSESNVSGAPFSADETNTTTQTLFDGNRIVNTSTSRVYRDSQGRTRTERTLSNIGPLAAGQSSVNISISDPVAGVHYTIDPESKTAYKTIVIRDRQEEAMTKLKQAVEQKQTAEARAIKVESVPAGVITYTTTMQRAERVAKREDLGNSNMAGVPVKGTRSTMVIPAGSMGNDRDINIVDERWYSPDLKMNIMTKHTDPRMGETVFQVNNLTRTNPDQSLFQVPADYQIKEGAPKPTTAGFKITKD